jgi:alcohol dehydrogenase class IV
VATIHSTIISGAGASSALLPLLAGKTSILLVTDKNVGALEATQAIHRLLAAEGREVEVIDTYRRSPAITMWRRSSASWAPASRRWSLASAGERTGCSKTAVSTSAP